MSIAEKLVKTKTKYNHFSDNLNCDSEKWFVFNTSDGRNPTLRKFSPNELPYYGKQYGNVQV